MHGRAARCSGPRPAHLAIVMGFLMTNIGGRLAVDGAFAVREGVNPHSRASLSLRSVKAPNPHANPSPIRDPAGVRSISAVDSGSDRACGENRAALSNHPGTGFSGKGRPGEVAAGAGRTAAAASGRLSFVAQGNSGVRLLPVSAVVCILDRGDQSVLADIEAGRIRWAFDVALEPERARHRKLLRILPACVDDIKAGRNHEISFDQALEMILPHEQPTLSAVDVQRALSVSEMHVYALLQRGELTAVSGHRRGPGGSACVLVCSFVEFLKRRRWPVPSAE